MSQSLSTVYLHLVFSTKGRLPSFQDPATRTDLHDYLGGISRKLDCPPVLIGGTEDHVHILARFGRSLAQADWVKELKRVSCLWIKERDPDSRDFSWQSGYGVFSVSASNLEVVRAYVERKEEHHERLTFQEEYRALLRKHGQSWDERYVWD